MRFLALLLILCSKEAFPNTISTSMSVHFYLLAAQCLFRSQFAAVTPSSANATEKLQEFMDVARNSSTISVHAGGEGHVYTTPDKPGVCLKVANSNHLTEFEASSEFLIALRGEIQALPQVSDYLHVVQVFEKGPGWILREFVTDSIPLPEAIQTDINARAALQRLRVEFSVMRTYRELALKSLKSKLRKNPPSANLHWSPSRRQVIVIDGF